MPTQTAWLPVLFLCVALARPAPAETWSAAGLTFSDELGGVRLISVSGSGTVADPLVIIEEITGAGPAILVIRAGEQRSEHGSSRVSPGFLSLAVIKIVRNRSRNVWGGFVLELREELDLPSPYGDGLSFDQMQTFRRSPESDRFERLSRVAEPYDRIRFSGGTVRPGASATFNFYITDTTTSPEFYLIQEVQHVIAEAPPASDPPAARASADASRAPPVSRQPRGMGVEWARGD